MGSPLRRQTLASAGRPRYRIDPALPLIVAARPRAYRLQRTEPWFAIPAALLLAPLAGGLALLLTVALTNFEGINLLVAITGVAAPAGVLALALLVGVNRIRLVGQLNQLRLRIGRTASPRPVSRCGNYFSRRVARSRLCGLPQTCSA